MGTRSLFGTVVWFLENMPHEFVFFISHNCHELNVEFSSGPKMIQNTLLRFKETHKNPGSDDRKSFLGSTSLILAQNGINSILSILLFQVHTIFPRKIYYYSINGIIVYFPREENKSHQYSKLMTFGWIFSGLKKWPCKSNIRILTLSL